METPEETYYAAIEIIVKEHRRKMAENDKCYYDNIEPFRSIYDGIRGRLTREYEEAIKHFNDEYLEAIKHHD